MHRLRVICQNVPREFIKLSMETPYLCPFEVHKYGRRDVKETIVTALSLMSHMAENSNIQNALF